MADVAHIAGVSITTVSHVLNHTRAVAAETEQAVLAAAATAGYVPDGVVRSQRTTGTRTIGLGISLGAHPYLGDLIRALHRNLSEAGYSILLADTLETTEGELRAVNDLVGRRVEALILAPSGEPEKVLAFCAKRKIPVVLVDRLLDVGLDQVASECIEATARLVDHLVTRHGHERIGYIAGKAGLASTDQRIDGYRLGLQRHGIAYRPELVVDGGSTKPGGTDAMRTLMAQNPDLKAVVSANNEMTIGVLAYAHESGSHIPDDVALVCYDDFAWADYVQPRLTVMAQEMPLVGAQAVDLVLSRLADPESPARSLAIAPRFVVRESCGCPPTRPDLAISPVSSGHGGGPIQSRRP